MNEDAWEAPTAEAEANTDDAVEAADERATDGRTPEANTDDAAEAADERATDGRTPEADEEAPGFCGAGAVTASLPKSKMTEDVESRLMTRIVRGRSGEEDSSFRAVS